MGRRRVTKIQRSIIGLCLGGLLLTLVLGLASMPRTAKDYHREARELVGREQFVPALSAFDRALREAERKLQGDALRESRATLLTERGECSLRIGRATHALEDFRQARTLEPTNNSRWIREGEAYLQAGRFEDAALLYQEASVAFPDQAQFFRYAAGCAYYHRSQADLSAAADIILDGIAGGRKEEFAAVLRRVVAGVRDADSVRDEFVSKEQNSPSRRAAWRQVEGAKEFFVKADELLADYHTYEKMDPGSGLIRARMDFESGRPYEMLRLIGLLLRVAPDPQKGMELRQLAANALFEIGAYEQAAEEFLETRNLLRRSEDRRAMAMESRRANYFAVESYLRAGNAKEVLDLLNPESILKESVVLNLFYLGRARFLADPESDYLSPLEKAVEALEVENYSSRGKWYRSKEHQEWILSGMLECLIAGKRQEKALSVASAGKDLFRGNPEWPRQRAEILREMGGQDEKVAEDSLQVLRSGIRMEADYDHWIRDELALWPDPEQLAEEIAYHARRVRIRYSMIAVDRKTSTDYVSGLLTQAARSKEDSQQRRKNSSALMADLRDRRFLAVQVYHQLLRDGDRDQAYLLMMGLADLEPDLLQFRYMQANQDLAEGRLQDAAEIYESVLDRDPTDLESAMNAWRIYRMTSQSNQARKLEQKMLDADPEGTGRMLAAMSAFREAFPEVALSVTQSADGDSRAARASRGLRSLILLSLGRKSEGKELAEQVLTEDPAEPRALAGYLLAAAKTPGDQQKRAVTKFLSEQEGTIKQLPVEQLWGLGRDLFYAEAFDLADRILRFALDKDPDHVPARLDLVNVLIGLERYDEAETGLLQLDRVHQVQEARRGALVRLLKDGPDEAYRQLRARSAVSSEEPNLGLWIYLMSSLSGPLAGSYVSDIKDSQLSEAQVRFLAMRAIVSDPLPSPSDLPATVQQTVLEFMSNEKDRDRELDRWISLELSSPRPGWFSRTMLPLLLIPDLPGMEPLLPTMSKKALNRFPKLGPVARDLAQKARREGEIQRANHWLVGQVQRDPLDPENLSLLALWSGELSASDVDKIYQKLHSVGVDPGLDLLLEGLQLSYSLEATSALDRLRRAAKALEPAGPALVAAMRVRMRELTRQRGHLRNMSPYSSLGAKNQVLLEEKRFQRSVEATLGNSWNDPTVLAWIIGYLEQLGDYEQIQPTLLLSIIQGISASPTPFWKAYRIGAEVLEQAGAPDELVDLFAISLRSSLEQHADAPRTSDTITALTGLSRTYRTRGHKDRAEALLELAQDLCPYDPLLLTERAAHATEPKEIERLRTLAQVCGQSDPEVLWWLADYAFFRDGAIDRAQTLANRARAALGEDPDADLALRVHQTLSQIEFLGGDSRKAVDALKPVVEGHLDIQAETTVLRFLDGDSRIREDLVALAETDHALAPLMGRLVTTLDAEETAKKQRSGSRQKGGGGRPGAGAKQSAQGTAQGARQGGKQSGSPQRGVKPEGAGRQPAGKGSDGPRAKRAEGNKPAEQTDQAAPGRPPRQSGERPARADRTEGGQAGREPRPRKGEAPDGDQRPRPPRREQADEDGARGPRERPSSPRQRPPAEERAEDGTPAAKDSDRSQTPRPRRREGQTQSGEGQRPRAEGTRPRGEDNRPARMDGPRPTRAEGDRAPRAEGERPARGEGPRPPRASAEGAGTREGERPRARRPEGERPARPEGDRPARGEPRRRRPEAKDETAPAKEPPGPHDPDSEDETVPSPPKAENESPPVPAEEPKTEPAKPD